MGPSQYYALALPLLFLPFERDKVAYLLYMLICVSLISSDGLAVGAYFWFMFRLLMLVVRFLRRVGGLNVLKS